MGMNSFSWKMDLLAARRKKRSSEETDSITITKTLTQLEGLSQETMRDLRGQPLEAIDLDFLKKKYADTPNLGRRVAPRFELKLSVVAFSASQSFRTESLNISETGALLKDSLPLSFFNQPFEILFTYENPRTGSKHHLLFNAKAVSGARISFQSAAETAKASLQTLFHGLEPIA